MPSTEKLDTHQKALTLNLDPSTFGSFAEIGAGQEVARVSRQRLEAMLDNEWAQLLTQLEKTRGSQTRFFSFVDTVSARNYAGTNDPHGWIGLRFQLQPGGPTNDILLHINLRDSSNVLQQEAIGILGVNLIHAAFYQLVYCPRNN